MGSGRDILYFIDPFSGSILKSGVTLGIEFTT